MADDHKGRGRAGGSRLTKAQVKLLEQKREEKRLNESIISDMEEMADLGLKLNKHQTLRMKGAKAESLIKENNSGLEKKLLKAAQSTNKVKQKQASLAQTQLKSLKESFKTTDMTEDAFKKQVDLVEELGTKIGTVEDIQDAITDLGEDATDEMKAYLDVQLKAAQVQETQKVAMEEADNLMGGMVSKGKDFVKMAMSNPWAAVLVAASAALAAFSKGIDEVGEKFGAMGVQQFSTQILEANAAMKSMGFESGVASDIAEQLSNNFGRTFEESLGLSTEIADMSKALGISTEEGTEFFGMMTQVGGMTDQAALDTARMAEQLAVANGVAPGAVLSDIAKSSETFAKFSDKSGDNMLRTAVQAKKLGLEMDGIAGIADSMLDFSTSIENEMKASVMTGKQLNFQRARELALVGDTEGMMKEVLNQVGTEEEFLAMNVKQREALAAAAGTDLATMMKLVAAEEDAADVAGDIEKKKGFADLVSKETMSNMTSMIASLEAAGAALANTFGPPLNMVAGVLETMAIGLEGVMNLLYAISPALYVAGAAMAWFKRKAIGAAIAGAWKKAMTGGAWGPWGIAAGIAAALLATGAIMRWSKVGDLMSPAKGKTRVSTKEGGLFELSPNDDLIAGPGLATAGGGGARVDMSPVVSAIGTLKEQIVLQQTQIELLRKDMKGYFGLGGTVAKQIGSRTANAVSEIG